MGGCFQDMVRNNNFGFNSNMGRQKMGTFLTLILAEEEVCQSRRQQYFGPTKKVKGDF